MTDGRYEEVRAAADRLMEAFSTGDEEGYFDCFHPDATFLFHGVDPIGSRDEYRALVRTWKDEHGFRVLSSTSHDAGRPRCSGTPRSSPTASRPIQLWDGEEATLHERESIVFQRQPRWRMARDPRAPLIRRDRPRSAAARSAQLDADRAGR